MIKLFSILIFLAPFCAQSAVLYTYLDTFGPNTKLYGFSYRAPDYLQLQPNTPFRISGDQFASCSGGVPNYACTSATLSTSANAQAPSVSVLLVLTDLKVPENEPFRDFYYVTNFRNAILTKDGEYSGSWDASIDFPDSFLTVKALPDATADAPEPATAAIALTGLALLAAAKLRRTRPATKHSKRKKSVPSGRSFCKTKTLQANRKQPHYLARPTRNSAAQQQETTQHQQLRKEPHRAHGYG